MTAVSRLWSICLSISLSQGEMRIEQFSWQAGWVPAVQTVFGGVGGLPAFFVVARWNSCPSSSSTSFVLVYYSRGDEAPLGMFSYRSRSQWIIIRRIHQQCSCNFERLKKKRQENGSDRRKKARGRENKLYILVSIDTVCKTMVLLTIFPLFPFSFSSQLLPFLLFLCSTHPVWLRKPQFFRQLVRKGPCQAFNTISN